MDGLFRNSVAKIEDPTTNNGHASHETKRNISSNKESS